MIITHVGSLPHLNIDDALNYTFKFDIPVLFTLPNLDKNQFMQNELKAIVQNGIPFHYNEFLRRAKEKKIRKIKYQLIGPVSFYKIHPHIAFSPDHFAETHNRVIKLLLQDFELLYVVDEPCLKKYNKDQKKMLSDFYHTIVKTDNLEIFVHCCNDIDFKYLTDLAEIQFHLDHSLFDSKDWPLINSPYIGIGKLAKINFMNGLSDDLDIFAKLPNNIRYISPGCGLACNSVKELDSIYNNLVKIKLYYSFRNKKNH